MNPEEFIADYELALAGQRWENVAPLVHDRACVTFSTGSVHKGIEAVKEAYEKNFSAIKNEEYSMTDVYWVMKMEKVAVYIFKFNWKGIINGQPAGGSGRGTATVIKENGKWKLLAEHLGAG